MFILEESQLLEDTIINNEVKDLYCILQRFEANGKLNDLLRIISSEDGLGYRMTRICLDFCPELLEEPVYTKIKLDHDLVEKICESINLTKDDLAALALVLSGMFLQLFIADNFTKHNNDPGTEPELPDIFKELHHEIDHTALRVDCCEVHHKVMNPWLLRISLYFYDFLSAIYPSRKLLHLEFLVWKHRLLTIHSSLILEPVESLMNELRKVQEFIFDHHILNDQKENKTQLVRFNIVSLCCELAQSALARGSLTFCRKFFDYATEISGIEVEHTGALGRRTRFQDHDISQLVVKVKRNETDLQLTNSNYDMRLPIDVKLDDDTLLPDIAFADNTNKFNDIESTVEEQLLMLNDLDILIKKEVMEESLKDEYVLAYLRTILKSTTIWSLKYKCLSLRSQVEKRNHRRMDRALRQLEALINETQQITDDSELGLRQQYFFAIMPPSKWQLQRLLGDISYDLGLFKNALELYHRIEFWEGEIKCLCAIQQTDRAEKLIRQELEKEATPYLYCLLGDVTDDIQNYELAWNLSKGRFARAKKSIGTHYYTRKEYEKAIENYKEAHIASPSNLSILSFLAYCYLLTDRYEEAAQSYRKITYLDDDSFLAWNNLSKAYIKLGQKERAWRTLREAVKCNYEEWKVWDNLMNVSMDIGAIDDVIMAWHRLIDIKSSHKNDRIIHELTYAILNRKSSEEDYEKLLSEAVKLTARLISTSDCSSRVWICYFKLLMKEHKLSSPTKQDSVFERDARIKKMTNALQRATPTLPLVDISTYQKPEDVMRLLGNFEELFDCYQYCLEELGPCHDLKARWRSFRLTMINTIKSLQKNGYVHRLNVGS